MLNAQDTLLKSLNNRQVSILLLLDFSKAFDTVDHNILLAKLAHYGIRGPALGWLKPYLSDRKQYVPVNNSDSSIKNNLWSTSRIHTRPSALHYLH